jgi:DNA-directed RNA polymerase beta' subunit
MRYSGLRHRHVTNESISAPLQRLDVGRHIRAVAERFPHLPHCGRQAALERNERALPPERSPQLFPRHQLARMFEQRPQQPERLLLQLNPPPVPPQFARPEIRLEGAEVDDSLLAHAPILQRRSAPKQEQCFDSARAADDLLLMPR